MTGRRPQTLAEVAELTATGQSFQVALNEFLDEFYMRPREQALSEPPRLLAGLLGRRGQVCDAYLAATADTLAAQIGAEMPDWAGKLERALREPWFASNMQALRATLLLESPIAFRARNLFVSENALSRA